MQDTKPTVLITGANGFVGSRLCRLFSTSGFQVIAGVRHSADLSLLTGIEVEYCYGDLSSVDVLRTMVSGADYIIHNAGVVKAKNPSTFFEVNEAGSRRLCEAILASGHPVKKVIYISSLAAAGPAIAGHPVTEADEPRPITTYGHSKLAGERAVLSYADRFHIIAVRPPGVYGPGDKEIFTFFQAINRGLRPLIGNSMRKIQLVHVDDLCRGILLALTGNTKSGEVYFIAENRAYTMAELIDMTAQASGRKGIPLRIPAGLFRGIAAVSEFLFRLVGATPMLTREKAGELLASWEVSTAKARESFGYCSKIPFPDGARETFAWYRREGWLA